MTYDSAGDVLRVATAGLPERVLSRGGRSALQAYRLDATDQSRRRARSALHAFVDHALQLRAATPWDAAAVHRAVELQQGAIRTFADGSVVASWWTPAAPLRDAWPSPEAPWAQ